jgi:hypothetical protein
MLDVFCSICYVGGRYVHQPLFVLGNDGPQDPALLALGLGGRGRAAGAAGQAVGQPKAGQVPVAQVQSIKAKAAAAAAAAATAEAANVAPGGGSPAASGACSPLDLSRPGGGGSCYAAAAAAAGADARVHPADAELPALLYDHLLRLRRQRGRVDAEIAELERLLDTGGRVAHGAASSDRGSMRAAARAAVAWSRWAQPKQQGEGGVAGEAAGAEEAAAAGGGGYLGVPVGF